MDNLYREGYLKGMEDAFKLVKEEIEKSKRHFELYGFQNYNWVANDMLKKFDSALAAIKEGE
jgi:hypothetical protein